MMDVSMDTVSVQIETVVNNSGKAIDGLITKLNSLQTTLKNAGKSSKNLPLADQLSKLKVSLNDKDIVSKFRNIDKETTKYKNSLGQVITVQKNMRKGIDDYKVSVRELFNNVNKFDKFKNSIAGIVTKIGLLFSTMQKVKNSTMEYVELSASFAESLNLFFTEMGSKAEQAYEWVNKFSNALYLDPADVMQYMGAFNSLVSGLGVGADRSYLMSKNLTQLTYDLASYKNLDFSTAYEKLMSGISGEIEPLRNTGVALSQATLQELANSMGIKQRINTMNEAQKAELRYIQIIRSSTNWQADLGKTLTSTENILKIAGQQWVLFKRALGDVATVIVRFVLPYMIALTQILTEGARALASFLGFEIDFSKFKTGTKSVSSGISQIGEDADTATKKLNTMLAPFDKLNVVQNKNESASSGLGGLGGGLGVDLPEYDALSKLTSEMSDQIEKAKKQIKSWIPIIKKAVTVLATLWALNKISKFITALKNIKSVFTLLKTPITKLSSPLKTLITRFSDGYKYSKFMGEKGLTSVLAGSRNLLGTLGKVSVTLAGVVASFATGYTEMKNYATGSQELENALLKTTAVTTAFGVAAFALVGWPAALAVGVAGLTGALVGYYQGLHEIEVHNEIFNQQGVLITDLSKNLSSTFENTSASVLKYSDTLNVLSDKYSNARTSMETARGAIDSFTNSLDLQDGKVTQSQLEELKSKYQTLKTEIKNTQNAGNEYYIALIKANAKAMANSDERTAKEIANYKKIASANQGYVDEYIAKEEELNLKYYGGKISAEEYQKAIQNLKIEYGYAKETTIDSSKAIDIFNDSLKEIDYSSVKETNEAIKNAKTSMEEQIKTLDEYKKNVSTANEEANKGYKEQIENLEYVKKYGSNWTEEQEKHLQTLYNLVTANNNETEKAVTQADKAIKEIQGSYKGYVEGIYADLVSKGATTSKEFKGTISTLKDEIKDLKKVDASGVGKQIKDTLIQGIIDNKPAMISKVRQELASVGTSGGEALDKAWQEQFQNLRPKIELNANKYLGQPAINGATSGMKSSIKKNEKEIDSVGQDIGNTLIKGTRKTLLWNSPSKVYEQCGSDIVDGLVNGLNKNKDKPSKTMALIVNEMIKETKKLNNAFSITFDTTKFTDSLNSLLGKLQTFSNKFRNGVNSLLSTFTTSMNGIKVGSDNKLYYTQMPQVYIPRFEQGGYPDKASLFFANENGIPELVGRIGNQTAVANNDQITTALTSALLTALSGADLGGQGTIVVNIGNKKVYEGMGEHIDSESERYGTSYINL